MAEDLSRDPPEEELEPAAPASPVPALSAFPEPPPVPVKPKRPSILLPLIVACALFMDNLDQAVLSTSLPAIARAFGESPIHLKVALTAYILAVAVCLPASGWLADRFGARNIFRLAILFFVFGSIGCGFSNSIGEMVFARILQGIGGSMMVPVGRLIVLRSVPKSEMINALAWVSTPALIGPLVGPLVGGFISTYFEWRWIFWVNIPIAVLGLVLATLYIPDVRGEQRIRFDFFGYGLMAFGLGAFVTGSQGLGVGLLPLWETLLLIAVGGALILGYVFYSRRHVNPILDLTLFSLQTFRIAVLGGFFIRAGVGASPFLLPLLFQYGYGMTAFQSGAITFISALGAIGMKPLAQPLLRYFGFRNVVLGNFAVVIVTLALPGLFPLMPLFVVSLILLISGFFRSLQFTTFAVLAFVDVPQGRLSSATTLNGVFQQLSLSMGISFGALMLKLQVGNSTNITADAFFWPFMTLGALGLLSGVLSWRLPKTAGEEVSGHHVR